MLPRYSFFSILVLPVNSVINPLLYDRTLTHYITAGFRRAKNTGTQILEELHPLTNRTVVEQKCPGNRRIAAVGEELLEEYSECREHVLEECSDTEFQVVDGNGNTLV